MKYLKKIETEDDVHLVTYRPNLVLINETKKVLYNVPTDGVYIQHIDGTLYTIDEWQGNGFTNSQANGIGVWDKDASFVIARTYLDTNIRWSNNAETVDGVLIAEDLNVAKTDYDGKLNTDLIVAVATSGAAYECANFTFPNGSKGYLPSLGEWKVVNKYKSQVVEALSAIGGTHPTLGEQMRGWRYWSSTQGPSGDYAWFYDWDGSVFGNMGKKDVFHDTPGCRFTARAFTKLDRNIW